MDTTEAPSPETLTSLIRDLKGRRSYNDLALESGPGLGRGRWQQLGDPSFPLSNIPRADTIRTLATVLKVPQRRVWLAIGREMDVDVDAGMSPLLANMVDGTASLTPEQTRMMLDLIAELVDLQLSVAGLRTALKDAREEAQTLSGPVRTLKKAARKTTGTETRGPRGGAKPR